MMSESEFDELRRLRQLDFWSAHLTVVDVSSIRNYEKRISDWIWKNTKGRFWIGDRYDDRTWKFLVGFEIPYEATYFNLKFFSTLGSDVK
jgi:hypothetical protein